MKKQIFQFLQDSGLAPEMSGEDILFKRQVLEQGDCAVLYIMLPEDSNYIRIGLSIEEINGKQIDMSIILDSINNANIKTSFAKAVIYDNTLDCGVEFQCDSVEIFKKHFQSYVDNVIAIWFRIADLIRAYNEFGEQQDRTKTAYDKIHYHTAYIAIPRAIQRISRFPNKTALKLDNKRTLMFGLLPRLTREELWAFPWDDLKITERNIEDGKRLMIYEFPEPRRSPQAKFGVVLWDSQNIPIDYITLERHSEDRDVEFGTAPELNTNLSWVLCTAVFREDDKVDPMAHFNYGLMKDEPTLENFIKAAQRIFNTPKNERPSYTMKGL